MSYSFSVRGTTKANVMEKAAAEFDKVVAAQPIHSADRAHAQSAVAGLVSVLPDGNDKQDIYVSVSGSVGWTGERGTADQVLASASLNVSASLATRE